MIFSQESCQAIFEMGNVELIELKTSRIQCPSCLHYVFKGTILCACGKHVRPDQEMIRRIKAAFPSVVTARGYKHGPNFCQEHHHKAKDALRSTKRAEEHLRQSGIDGKMTRRTGSLNLPLIGRMLGWDTWTTLHKLFSLIKHRRNKEVDTTIYFISEVLTKIDRHHFYQQGQGTKKQRLHQSRCKGNRDKYWETHLSQKVKGGAYMINSNLHCEGTLSGWV